MALIFQNPAHDLVVAEMLNKSGKMLGEAIPPATGVLGSLLFGGELGEGDDAKTFAGLLESNKPLVFFFKSSTNLSCFFTAFSTFLIKPPTLDILPNSFDPKTFFKAYP